MTSEKNLYLPCTCSGAYTGLAEVAEYTLVSSGAAAAAAACIWLLSVTA